MRKNRNLSRRDFLKSLLPGAAAVAALAVTDNVEADEEVVSNDAQNRLEHKGYRETDHIRRYYQLARF